jgi:hypothetical protein
MGILVKRAMIVLLALVALVLGVGTAQAKTPYYSPLPPGCNFSGPIITSPITSPAVTCAPGAPYQFRVKIKWEVLYPDGTWSWTTHEEAVYWFNLVQAPVPPHVVPFSAGCPTGRSAAIFDVFWPNGHVTHTRVISKKCV